MPGGPQSSSCKSAWDTPCSGVIHPLLLCTKTKQKNQREKAFEAVYGHTQHQYSYINTCEPSWHFFFKQAIHINTNESIA